MKCEHDLKLIEDPDLPRYCWFYRCSKCGAECGHPSELTDCPKCGAEYAMEHHRHRFSTEGGPNMPDADWDVCSVCGYQTDPE